jgi:hypothetical protein
MFHGSSSSSRIDRVFSDALEDLAEIKLWIQPIELGVPSRL